MSFPCPLKREDVLRACGFDMNGVISTALISAFPGIHGELALCIVAGNLRRGMKQQMVKVKDLLGLDPAYFPESDKTRIACWIRQVCVEDCFLRQHILKEMLQ